MDDIEVVYFDTDIEDMSTVKSKYFYTFSSDGKRKYESVYIIRKFTLKKILPWHMFYEVVMPNKERVFCYMSDDQCNLIEYNSKRVDILVAKLGFFGWTAVRHRKILSDLFLNE